MADGYKRAERGKGMINLILISTGWIAFGVISIVAHRQIKQQSFRYMGFGRNLCEQLEAHTKAHETETCEVDRTIKENRQLRQRIAKLEYVLRGKSVKGE